MKQEYAAWEQATQDATQRATQQASQGVSQGEYPKATQVLPRAASVQQESSTVAEDVVMEGESLLLA
jgi:hypothetical protein